MVALIRKSFLFRALHPPICAGISVHHATRLLRSVFISPTPYPRKESLVALAVLSGSLQASFRVPGDLAREDDLCEEIALIELVSNN